MNRFFLPALLMFLSQQTFSQATWAGEIAEIFYAKCATCHRDNGIAPFSLMTYQDAVSYVDDIQYAIESGHMPPWSPDTLYQRYAHERILTAGELAKIHDWLFNGTPSGNLAETPPPPVFSDEGFIQAPADLELSIPLYTSQATAFSDDYVCFSIPSGLLTGKKIRAFEVIPGNPAIVHHCLIYVDPTGNYQTNLSGFCTGPTDGLIGGYTPGSMPTVFPSNGSNVNMGYTIPTGSNIVFAMHYPSWSQGQQDQTKIRFWFYPQSTNIREITTTPILQNWNFTLPANQVTTLTADWNQIPINVSLLSVFPHMHLLGTYIEAYGLTPQGDTLKLVRIPHWDFHWQQFYFFKNIIKVPANSTLHSIGVYDNTTDNPHNPNNPPVSVGPGLNTSDEMFLVYFHYLPYFPGDELLDLDALTQFPTVVGELTAEAESRVEFFPNPVKDIGTFRINTRPGSLVSISIYDSQGRLISKPLNRVTSTSDEMLFEFDFSGIHPGVYFFSASLDGSFSSGRILLGRE
jgi:hypothetical protein